MAVLVPGVPIDHFRQGCDGTHFIRCFYIVAAPDTFQVVFVRAQVNHYNCSIATHGYRHPITHWFPCYFENFCATIRVRFVTGGWIVRVGRRRHVFLFNIARPLRWVLDTWFPFLFTTNHRGSGAVLNEHVFRTFYRFRRSAWAYNIVVRSLWHRPTRVNVNIDVTRQNMDVRVHRGSSLLQHFTFVDNGRHASHRIVPTLAVVTNNVGVPAVGYPGVATVARLLGLLTGVVNEWRFYEDSNRTSQGRDDGVSYLDVDGVTEFE